VRAFAGSILTAQGWLDGHVLVEAGRVAEVRAGPPPVQPVARGTITPAFVNAHTHLGDAVARTHLLPATLEEAVRPPHGYKHRVLATTPSAEIVEAMRAAAAEVEASGAAWTFDFREGGLTGLQQLNDALPAGLRARVYARPASMEFDAGEVASLLGRADGLSASSLPDDSRAGALAEAAHKAGKGFATHASEGAREPLDPVLDLRPELLVHLTFATRADLERVRDARIPIAVCPRSNARWVKRLPDLRAMLDLEIPVALGTDNAMLGPSDVRAEARALLDLAPSVRPDEAVVMVALRGWHALGRDPWAVGAPADLLVWHRRSAQPAGDVLGTDASLLHRERAQSHL
jgi:cytosine/adenosine deaminase-related metal-dependent hydrolase